MIVIETEQFEIRARRAAADAKPQPPARQRLDRLHPMGKLDRMAQRQLQDPDAEFDPLGHGGEDRQFHQRIERRAAASHRISDPDPRKPGGFDTAGIIGRLGQQPVMRRRVGTEPDHCADFH